MELSDLRKAIVDEPVSQELIDEARKAHLKLCPVQVAVRSSGTHEDLAGHSFAGLYDTYLGVTTLEELLAAMKKCWASLWTERAFQYRVKNGFDHATVEMAVIVQEMVPAEISGVVFLADPLTGRADRLVIEASFGLGEAIVSGRVSPDRLVLARDGLELLEQTISAKSIKIVAGSQGLREEAVDSERSRSACLDQATARRLAGLALKAESALGGPQDMEWAIVEGQVYFLQSRPITSRPRQESWEDRQIWSNLNAGEVLPDVASPLTWSTIQFLLQRVFGLTLQKLGLELDVRQLIGLVAGRGYFNLNAFIGIFHLLPGLKSMDVLKMFGGAQEMLTARGFQFRQDDIPNFSFRWVRVLGHLPGFALWLLAHSTHRGIGFAKVLRRRVEALERINLEAATEAELAGLLRELLDNSSWQAETIAFGVIGAMHFSQLFSLCRRWLVDHDGSLANRLLVGLGNMDSAESGLALWRLAKLALAHPQVEQALQAGADFQTTRQTLMKVPGGAEFLTRWDAFMARHGHHTRGEVDVMNPRWRETPDLVLDLVRSYLKSAGADPIAAHSRCAAERRQLAAACRQQLRNPIKRLLFAWVLDQAQRGCRVRENIKSEAVRALSLARSLFKEIGVRLTRRGVFATADDVFFMRMEEIGPLLRGTSCGTVTADIAARRTEYLKNLALSPPPIVIGRFDPSSFTPEPVDATRRVFKGLAVSAGSARGKARVILRSDSREQVLPGEVLVAPFTDPGWTPHFLNAVAIVMDLGGLLSHGCIVAREYGIPAVANVGPATRIIQTGQTLYVDGTRGEVQILE
jgi:pyruvate,water dikinase